MTSFTDQLGREVVLPSGPIRIVSLVPSQTELLFDLGLAGQVVGVTKFCVHPALAKKSATIIGGTKNIHIDRIQMLQPDLVIANKEENNQADIDLISKICPVWVSDMSTIQGAFEMIKSLGRITQTEKRADAIIDAITLERSTFQSKKPFPSAIYMIWKKPWMAAGKSTFIDTMMQEAGFENAVNHERYPSLSEEELIAVNPKYLLLSSEPYPFRQSDLDEISKILPNTKILMVDGEMFSWYGSRLRYAWKYFQQLPR